MKDKYFLVWFLYYFFLIIIKESQTFNCNLSDSSAYMSSFFGPLGINPKRNQMALIKLETVFFTYLWSLDLEAVLTSMSCFRLLCQEAKLWSNVATMTLIHSMPENEKILTECDCHPNRVLTNDHPSLVVDTIDWTDKSLNTINSCDLNSTKLFTTTSNSDLCINPHPTSSEYDPRSRSGPCIALCSCGCPLCTPVSYLPICTNAEQAIAMPTSLTDFGLMNTNNKCIQSDMNTTSSTNNMNNNNNKPCTSTDSNNSDDLNSFRSNSIGTGQSIFLDFRLPDLLPVYSIYAEIAEHSRSILTTGRAHLQKQILALLRKINYQTQGNKLVWISLMNIYFDLSN